MVYVSNYDSDTVLGHRRGNREGRLHALRSVSGQRAVAVDPTTGMIYVADFFGQSVSVINDNTDKVTATIEGVGLNPNSIAVDRGD